MQEIIDFILFKNHQLNKSQDIGLSDIVYIDKDGFQIQGWLSKAN